MEAIKIITLCLVLGSSFIFLSCDTVDGIIEYFTKEPEVEAIEEVIQMSVPLGYVAQVAMAAANGEELEFDVQMVSNIENSIGWATMIIPVSKEHPLPIGNKTGTIMVTGYWSSKDEAVLSMAFTDFDIMVGSFSFVNIEAFPVVRTEEGLSVSYMKVWMNMGDLAMGFSSFDYDKNKERMGWKKSLPLIDTVMNQNVDFWTVVINDKNTPG